jgi:hypothetical protein
LQQSDIETEFAGILEKTAGVHRANLGPDTRLQSDLGLDSLAMIDVAAPPRTRSASASLMTIWSGSRRWATL